nr:ParB/RepB/Spo0J family partition protein [Providencia rettgeri]
MAKKQFLSRLRDQNRKSATEAINNVIETKSPNEEVRDIAAHQIMTDIARPELETEGQIIRVPIDEVYAESQVRPEEDFDDSIIEGMADTFNTVGILTPPRCYPKDRNGYRIWMGETRWRTAKKRGDSFIDIYVGSPPKNDKFRIIGQLIENLQQSGLKPLATAVAFNELKTVHGMTGEEIAKTVGKPTSFVSKHLKLISAPESVTTLLKDKVTLDVDLAYTLTQINEINPEIAEKLVEKARKSGVSRNEAKDELSKIKNRDKEKNSHAKSKHISHSKSQINTNDLWHVQVEFDNKIGIILTDKKPESDGFVWVKHENSINSVNVDKLIVKGLVQIKW